MSMLQNSKGGGGDYVHVVKLIGGDYVHFVKFIGGDYVHVAKFIGGTMSML